MLYGTTYFGGDGSPSYHGDGTIYAIGAPGKETVLYRFLGGTNGGNPEAGLLDVKNALYGTTSEQGLSLPTGDGTVFRFVP